MTLFHRRGLRLFLLLLTVPWVLNAAEPDPLENRGNRPRKVQRLPGPPAPEAEPESARSAEDHPFRVGKIRIHRKNVFETGRPSDQLFLYRTGNRIHVVTRERFIRHELLFREGDPYDPEAVAESERLLRRLGLFRYVSVTPSEPLNGAVDITVETEDVWTTSLQLDYGLVGAKQTYAVGFLEQNFLGTGKTVGAFVRQDIDRFVRGASYRDPSLFGTRWETFAGYGRDEKGREYETRLERPFYAASVKGAGGVVYRNLNDQGRLFSGGEERLRFSEESNGVRAYAARSFSDDDTRVRRAGVAFERSEDHFAHPDGVGGEWLPIHRVVAPLLLTIQAENRRFIKMRGVRTFDRDEDVNLGASTTIEAGPSLEGFGASRDGALARIGWSKNVQPVDDAILFNEIQGESRYERDRLQNAIARLRSELYVRDWRPRHTASARGEYVVSRNLDPEIQFLLGGDNGLRGYPVRQFDGPKRLLLTFEDRRTVADDWLELLSFGWAVFFDTGAVWRRGTLPEAGDMRSDVGAGLRLAPSRSVDAGLLRVDLAYALQNNARKSKLVINIGADVRFGDRREKKFQQ